MDHKDLIVWKKGMSLVEMIYTISSKFPASENNEVIHLITDEKKLLLGYRNHIRKKVSS